MKFVYDQLSTISIYHNSRFTFEDVESIMGPLFESHYGVDGLRSIISSVDHIWCVYDRELNRYIACALVQSHDHKNVLYIKLFGVDEFSQGQGIGTRLLKAIKKWGRREKYFATILHAQIYNDKAIGLYEKVGFRKQFYLQDFFRPHQLPSFIPFHQSDAYQMILYL